MRECLCYPLPLHTLPSVAFHFHYTLSFPVCFAGIEFSSLAAWDWCFWIYPSFHVYILSHCALSGGTPESDCTCQGWKQSTIYKGTVSCYCLAVVRWGTSRQYLFFFCCLFSRPCNTEELCFVSCHSQKNTDVKQKVLWLMADQRRQRWKKAVECICAHNHSSLSHQECMIQPASRARAAPLGLAYQKLCWTWCSLSRAACRALFPGLWQGTFWFSFGSCEPRLGLL